MGAVDISPGSLLVVFLLLTVPLFLSYAYSLKIARSLFYSVSRMCVQLVLIGFFLKFLFLRNNAFFNLLWLVIMVLVAVYSALSNFSMRASKVLLPAFISFFLATFSVVLFVNVFVIKIVYVFDARYLIILGGMLLGNSLRGNIIGISHFYQTIRKDRKRFLYVLSLGASLKEATLPYLRQSLSLALKPTLAAMATMGIVALPGMMTGVILGGASPQVAIKYQIMIMIAIVTSTMLSVFLTIVMTRRSCFTKYGILKSDIFI
ncbi:MAG: ABC transporter permease [Candidatus Omnitrophica bacterium]|nr:ABC transporter permease [Candidatus Omnitrophota bacterium]